MEIINYIKAKIKKIEDNSIVLITEYDQEINWPKNKISDLDVYEGKEINIILGTDKIIEEQKNELYKKLINELLNEKKD